MVESTPSFGFEWDSATGAYIVVPVETINSNDTRTKKGDKKAKSGAEGKENGAHRSKSKKGRPGRIHKR